MPTLAHSHVVIAGVHFRAALKGLNIASFLVGSAPPGKAKGRGQGIAESLVHKQLV